MKSVTGEIKSTTPVTLSRAATFLSNFVKDDTGASQAVNAYLQLANSAFRELVEFHANFHHRRHERHNPDPTATAPAAAGPTTSLATVDDSPRVEQSNPTASAELNNSKSVVIEEEQRKCEGNGEVEEEFISKKKKKNGSGTSTNEEKSEGVNVKVVDEGNGDVNLGGEKSKKKKKDMSKANENGEVDGYKENGGSISEGLNVKEENRKKRKSGEAEEQRRDDQSEERPRKKRK